VVKIFAFPRSKSGIFDLNLNKNEHFSKVSLLDGLTLNGQCLFFYRLKLTSTGGSHAF